MFRFFPKKYPDFSLSKIFNWSTQTSWIFFTFSTKTCFIQNYELSQPKRSRYFPIFPPNCTVYLKFGICQTKLPENFPIFREKSLCLSKFLNWSVQTSWKFSHYQPYLPGSAATTLPHFLVL